jgi:hypothetical protein
METPAAFTTYDLKDFAENLRRALQTSDGTATFETDEEPLSLTIQFAKTGSAKVSGVLRGTDMVTVSLSFAFESDQSFLQETARQLDEICRVFPPKGD